MHEAHLMEDAVLLQTPIQEPAQPSSLGFRSEIAEEMGGEEERGDAVACSEGGDFAAGLDDGSRPVGAGD